MANRWRTRSLARSGGHYWLIETGRNETRRSISLKYVTSEQAERARAKMQREEDEGTVARVWALHTQEPDRAVEYLVEDVELAKLAGPAAIDYGALTLADYFDREFWPMRCDATKPLGVSEATAEAELGYWRHKGGTSKKPRERRGILDGDLASVRLRDLDDQVWQRWQDAQEHLSPRAKVLYRNAYAALLTWARRQGHLAYRPEFFRIKGSTKRTRPHAGPMVFTGKAMHGWITVHPPGFESDAVLRDWVDRSVAHARSLPAKDPPAPKKSMGKKKR